MITAASAAAQKLGLKVKQMDVVVVILSEHEVLIKRCGKSHVATAKTQRRFSSIMRIQPTTVKQLSHSLEIEMAQVVKKYIYMMQYF